MSENRCQESDRPNPQEVILFLHLPKTAGTTVGYFLDRQFRPEQVFTSYRADPWCEFTRLSPGTRDRLRVVMGHLEFGVHEWFDRPSSYVTLLRHPVDRLVSYYYYARRHPTQYLHPFLMQRSLEEFATSAVSVELDNAQVRCLSGRVTAPFGSVTRADLHQAKNNLRSHFAVVGVQENVKGFLDQLCRRFGLCRLRTPRLNVTPNRPALANVPQRVSDAMLERNDLDLELYRFVKETWASGPVRRPREGLPHGNRLRQLASWFLSCLT